MKRNCIIGIDIGGTNFRIGAVDIQNQVTDFWKIPTSSVFCTEDSMADLTRYMKYYCQKIKLDGVDIQGIAIGFPTTINKERTRVIQAPNIPFMENLPVVETLERELDVPVFIERDVTMALLYDMEMYNLNDAALLVGCYFGTGLGNAIRINGRMLIGKNGTAGELGHIPVDGSEDECGCGNVGCMENVGAGKYLKRLCEEKYKQTPIDAIFTVHREEPLLRQFVDRMAQAVATEVNILDPDCVLIGGGVPEMKDFPKEYLKDRILFHTRKPYPAENLQMIFTRDAEDKSVIGAAVYARSMLEK